MSGIDERVVGMTFENSKFESGVQTTLSSLDKLKSALNLGGAAKGLNDLQSAGDRFNLSRIADGVDAISSKFTALGIAGVTALANIANRAVSAGINLVKSLTIDPLKSGLDEYNTQMTSVQTILANTSASGATLKDVNATLNELNTYADKTIYNFSEMARNIGTFTAAGVDLKTSQESIKGIANLAALSGSNTQQASTAMYQLSQAISSGKVGLQDWNSVVNAGMGGAVFQRSLAQTAVAMGELPKSALKLSGAMKNVSINGESFRESISAKGGKGSWLSSKVLTNTLKILSNDLSSAQIKAMGFTDAQATAMKGQAEMAMQAATVVKTLPDLIGTVKESVGSGWTTTWQLIFGDFDQAKSLFTGAYKALNKIVSASANARNNLLKDWQDAGGRAAAIDAVKNAFNALGKILAPITKAMHEVFPPLTGKQLAAITKGIDEFIKKLTPGKITTQELHDTFKGLFALLDIGVQVIKAVIGMFGGVFKSAGDVGGSFLDITATIGNFLVNLDEAIKNGKGLTTFFDGLGAVISVPVKLIGALIGSIASLATGAGTFDGTPFTTALDSIKVKLHPLQVAIDIFAGVWAHVGAAIQGVWKYLQPIANALGGALASIGQNLVDSLQNVNYDDVLNTVNTVLFGGLILLIKKFVGNMGKGGGGLSGFGGGIFGTIKETFEGLTGTLQAMQQNLKANVLLKIAGALAILTVSVIALSAIDAASLTRALGAMTAMFIQLGASMAVFGKISVPGLAKMPILTTAMILLAIAIDILANAVTKLSKLDWQGLAKGLIGVTVLLGVVTGAAKGLSGVKGLMRTGVGLILLATAINILATAVNTFGKMDLGTMIQGLSGVGVALGIIAGFSRIVDPKGMVATGLALVLLGAGLNVITTAVGTFGGMDLGSMIQGLTAMAVALGIIAGAVALLPGPTLILTGAGLVVVASALVILANAMVTFGSMSWAEIGQGLTVLAGALLLISVALIAMEASLPGAAALIVAAGALAILAPAMVTLGAIGWANIGQGLTILAGVLTLLSLALIAMEASLPGAAALVVAAGALAILAPVMIALGNMSWDQIGQGLTVLAGALAILGIAGALMTPVIPTLLGLGGAIALLGLGMALAGVGVLAFSAGLTGLAVAGAAGAVGLTAVFTAILNLIPLALTKLGDGIVALAGVVTRGAPAIVGALVAVLVSLIDAIGKLAPLIVRTLVKLVMMLVDVLVKNVPKLVDSGLKLLTGIYNGIAKNIGKLVTAGANVIVAFINGIANNLQKVIDAGINLIVKFVNGLADGIRKHTTEMRKAGANLADAIIDGITGGITDGIGKVVDAAKNLAGNALQAAKNLLGIHSPSKEFYNIGVFINEGLALGLMSTHDIVTSAIGVLKDDVTALKDSATQSITDYTQKISDLKTKIAGDNAAIAKQQQALKTSKDDRKSGETVDKDTIAITKLTIARQNDQKALAKAQAAVKKHNTAENRLKVDSAKANLASNALAIKDAKAKLAKDKADRKNGTTVAAQQRALNALVKTRDADNKALKDSISGLANAKTELAAANAANALLNGSLKTQVDQLEGLAAQNDVLSESIANQQKVLEDATKARDDYNQTITDQYDALQAISSDTSIVDYEESLRQQIVDTKTIADQLQTLRSRGLDDTWYKKLLAEGVDAMPFIQQLLDQGTDGVTYLNGLTDQLQAASKDLGSIASNQLYQAGIDAAQGLLDGLVAQQAAIEAQMNVIAQSMITAIKTALGIKSPSREFKAIGGYSGDGLVQGLKEASSSVTDAAVGVGNTALDALKKTMSGISDAVSSEIDMNPTIRPVLDLSAVQQGAAGLGGMLGNPSLSANGSYANAIAAANGYQANQEAYIAAKSDLATAGGVSYVQNNYSPKALSNAEIYRQTKNQISVAKGAASK